MAVFLGFQPNAFQANAFQQGYQVVAAPYSLASPAFAAPTINFKYNFSSAAYSLSSPAFATPALTSRSPVAGYSLGSPSFASPSLGFNYHFSPPTFYWLASPSFATPNLTTPNNRFTANPYSLQSPAFARPSPILTRTLHANAFTLQSPTFALAGPAAFNFHFFANTAEVSGLDFAKPSLVQVFRLSAPGYSLQSPSYAPPYALFNVNHVLTVAPAYDLDHPRFGHPRLQTAIDPDVPVMPPSYITQVEEASRVVEQLMNYVLMSIPPGITAETNNVRRLASTLRDHAEAAIRDNTLGTQLAQVVNAAIAADATYGGIERARQYLMAQNASASLMTQIVFRSALPMILGLEVTIIQRHRFTNQEQTQNMIAHVRQMFEDAKAIGVDEVDAGVYQAMNAMGGKIMNYLSRVELQLPRYILWSSKAPMPSLWLANRIYADATKSDEIEAENRIVNPAFVPRQIRVLSNVQVNTVV